MDPLTPEAKVQRYLLAVVAAALLQRTGPSLARSGAACPTAAADVTRNMGCVVPVAYNLARTEFRLFKFRKFGNIFWKLYQNCFPFLKALAKFRQKITNNYI